MEIIYLNSFSRSGETLLLRTLNAHSDIKVLHQILNQRDEGEEIYDLFRFIRKKDRNRIRRGHRLVKKIGVGAEKILLVKNSSFEINQPHNGIILVRNPFSACLSYMKMSRFGDTRKQMRNWALNIDQHLVDVTKFDELLFAFCSLYNRKMAKLSISNQPVIHYELFVNNPKRALKPALEKMNIQWEDKMLNSHTQYAPGQKGHGGIDLSAPINSDSVHSYLKLNESDFRKIYGMCYPVMQSFGYEVDENRRITIYGENI